MISVGQPHRAVPLTGALCLAVACRVPGSVAHDLVRQGDLTRPVRIGHPSGSILVAAEVTQHEEGFRVRQFFMRDYAEEASLLSSLDQVQLSLPVDALN